MTKDSAMFRPLSPLDKEKFQQYARENKPDFSKWEIYHPVARAEWQRQIDFMPDLFRAMQLAIAHLRLDISNEAPDVIDSHAREAFRILAGAMAKAKTGTGTGVGWPKGAQL